MLIDGRFTIDDLSRPLALGAEAQRIVTLAPNCTDAVVAIGAGDRLVGVDEHSDAPVLDGVRRVGGFKHHDLDDIVSLAPDLVVAASLHALRTAPRLNAKGIPVFITQPRTVDTIIDGMARLASLIGIARAAAPYLDDCRRRIAAVVERTLGTRRRPVVYVEYSPDHRTGGPQSFLDDLISKAGGANLGGAARVEWPVLAESTILRYDPDVIVIARYAGSASREELMRRPGWQGVSALKAGRVIELSPALVKRPGPGVIDGVETLAEIIAAI